MKPPFQPIWFVLCLAAASAHAQSQPQPQPLPAPLVQAAQAAVLQSPEVLERWRALQATRQQAPLAAAGWRPQVDLQANLGRQERRTPTQSAAWMGTSGVQVNLSQLLFDGGQVSAAMRQASQAELAAYFDLRNSSEAVALQVVLAYLELLRLQQRVALATENYVEHRKVFDAIGERTRAGVGRRVDAEQAQARLAVAESTLVGETRAFNEAGLNYQRFVGQLPPAQLPAWPDGRSVAPLPDSASAALRQGLEANPQLRAAYHRWLQAQQAVEGRQAAFMPRVEARLSASESRNRDGVRGEFRDQVAELVLTHNLYRGGADSAALQRATELQSRSRAEMDVVCRQVQQNLSIAFNETQTLRIRQRLADAQRLAVEKSATALRQQFDIGQRSLLDVLDTQAEFFDAARTYVDAQHEQLRAEARTLASMGQLVAQFGAAPAGQAELDALGAQPSGFDAAALCPAQVTHMESLERIKAGLVLPAPAARADRVVLLPNPDGSVGQVVVTGRAGQQVLGAAFAGTDLTGAAPAVAVPEEQVRRDFGDALAAQPQRPERFTLYFQDGSVNLTQASAAEWPQVLQRLRARTALDLTVAGHTDTIGSTRLNEALALRRAQAIAQRLRASGLQDVVIAIEGFGERLLEVPTPDGVREGRNRRVVISAR
ncbi:TolC family outer membrane protein [Serpentinimonas barnesii]|uniref:TolC family outer membrane protein n=1 Tax=Serpentinimonas barnesii TaxID=1458427 RepID=UPI000693EFC6|nr:TolC family outer membrane protein [Serpentinimonas barnesii]